MGKTVRIFFVLIFFLLGLGYMLMPAPQSINDISGLPNSLKSTEPGDTVQNPNIAAYFSDFWREDVTNFYQSQLQDLNKPLNFFMPVIRLNHPPEEAFQFIRDQQRATYLEQYIYPLRGSLFVNGYEPISVQGKRFDSSSVPIQVDGRFFNSKTTLRFYPVPLHIRIFIYLSSWAAVIGIYLVVKKIWKDLKS